MSERILINFPTNIGDVFLALPVLDKIHACYCGGTITAIASPATQDFLSRMSHIDAVRVFNKRWPVFRKMKFALKLWRRFDIVVDLKNSLLPVFIGPAWRTSYLRRFSPGDHITRKYLKLIEPLGCPEHGEKSDCLLSLSEKERWERFDLAPSVGVACSSRFHLKEYPYENVARLVDILRTRYPVMIFGTQKDRQFYRDIPAREGVIDLVDKTGLADVFYLMKKYCRVLIAVDSSLMHLASYLDIPVVGLFGPTLPARSKPLSNKSVVLQHSDVPCVSCEGTECENENICMNIDPESVAGAVEVILRG